MTTIAFIIRQSGGLSSQSALNAPGPNHKSWCLAVLHSSSVDLLTWKGQNQKARTNILGNWTKVTSALLYENLLTHRTFTTDKLVELTCLSAGTNSGVRSKNPGSDTFFTLAINLNAYSGEKQKQKWQILCVRSGKCVRIVRPAA
jgi:hypothetical protein